MKYLKTLNVANNHIVKVYNNNSNSNYSLTIACFMIGNKQPIIGTTLHSNTDNHTIKDLAYEMLGVYYKEELKID